GRSNDFTPFRALLGDEGSKLGWCVPLRHDAKRHEALGGFRSFKIRRQRRIELIDDRLRRAGTGEKTLPAAGIVARHRFGKRRHAGSSGFPLAESVTRAFSLPALISGNAGGISTNSIETLPLAMSVRPGTAPLYGIW